MLNPPPCLRRLPYNQILALLLPLAMSRMVLPVTLLQSEAKSFIFRSLQGNGIGQSGAKVISDTIRSSAPSCIVDI